MVNPQLEGQFEAAVDAVIAGDEDALGTLIERTPQLTRGRSSRAHQATLLHYVAANGVEDERQRTPANAPAIARVLLEHGALVDASANVYGGGIGQTTLNLLVSSVHPARAGLQVAIVHALLDFGAAINGPEDQGSPLHTALSYFYPAAADALVERGARVDTVPAAAGLGDVDLVTRLVSDDGKPRPGARRAPLPWLESRANGVEQVELGLIWAAAMGHLGVVELLTRRGVDAGAADHQGFTALHWGAVRGHVDVVDLLLSRGAPLDARNIYGGTVLSAVRWASVHARETFGAEGPRPVDHTRVVEHLLAAGAR